MFCGYVKEFYSKNIDRKFKQSNLKVRYGNKEEIKMFESGNKDKKIYILGSSGYLSSIILSYIKIEVLSIEKATRFILLNRAAL